MTGRLGILNVGAGDTKLVFDKSNPAECIRASRIVADMLKRGYALIVEVPDGKGGKHYARAEKFDEATAEYIIADFNPTIAAKEDEAQNAQADPGEEAAAAAPPEQAEGAKRYGRPTKRVPASSTSAIAVSRSAGG